jgi:hypothetical protein
LFEGGRGWKVTTAKTMVRKIQWHRRLAVLEAGVVVTAILTLCFPIIVTLPQIHPAIAECEPVLQPTASGLKEPAAPSSLSNLQWKRARTFGL